MGKFNMTVAGRTAAVVTNFESTQAYFRDYLTETEPDFSVTVTRADMDLEQKLALEEAREEGIRPRIYTDPHLERAAIQRKFAEHLFFEDTILLHGSTVAVDGEAYLFTAKCGTGKSTHTRLWREVFGSRAVMINDDKPFLRITREGVTAFGSPWAGKHGLHSSVSAPLKGICILHRGSENRIVRIPPEEAMELLHHQAGRPLDPAAGPRFLALVDALAKTVPLWRMECTKAPEAALIAHNAMAFPENS